MRVDKEREREKWIQRKQTSHGRTQLTANTCRFAPPLFSLPLFSPVYHRCDPSSVYSTNMTNDKSYHGLVVFGLSVSVFIVTSSILLCQAITLNRSHLAAVAIVSGEWVNVDEEYTNKPNPPPPSWDPAKKYSKGDRVMVHFPRDNIYKAGTNNPIARPTDVFLRGERARARGRGRTAGTK